MQEVDNDYASAEAEALSGDEVNRLIDLAVFHMRQGGRRYNEHTLFFSVLPDTPESHKRWLTFLYDVRTCPPEVIAEARRILVTRPMAHTVQPQQNSAL